MAVLGYTNISNVANFLGLTLSTQQQTQATFLLSIAEDVINNRTRRAWIQPAITNEQYDLLRDWVQLRVTPVVSIQSVTVRTRAVADPGITLVAGVDYELQDAQRGLIVLTSGYGDPGTDLARDAFSQGSYGAGPSDFNVGAAYNIARSYALISYTPGDPVPDRISHAATMLVAHWLLPMLYPDRYGLTSRTRGTRTDHYLTDIPNDVMAILDRNKLAVFG